MDIDSIRNYFDGSEQFSPSTTNHCELRPGKLLFILFECLAPVCFQDKNVSFPKQCVDGLLYDTKKMDNSEAMMNISGQVFFNVHIKRRALRIPALMIQNVCVHPSPSCLQNIGDTVCRLLDEIRCLFTFSCFPAHRMSEKKAYVLSRSHHSHVKMIVAIVREMRSQF